jgi:NAD(P)-dependent dehydrogenase (short-subunit alcohol dehydrogenase family)
MPSHWMLRHVSFNSISVPLAKYAQRPLKRNQYPEGIDRLVNNAAIMVAPYSLMEDGVESQFATNHLCHFVFTNLIMPRILTAGPKARIVSVSSSGQKLYFIQRHQLWCKSFPFLYIVHPQD